MTTQEVVAQVKRIVDSNTTYTEIHQQADPVAKVNVKNLKDDLEFFVEKLLSQR